jgi:23S rRNA pseudouridine955/2504/2580 synthase
MKIERLFEDENFLIVNKPNGLVVHNTVDKKRLNLYDILRDENPNQYLGLVHRLDKDTSGAIVLTKSESVNKFIQDEFLTHRIEKKYLCITHGEWVIDQTIEDFLKKEKNKNKIELMVKVLKGGVKAISLVKTIKHSSTFSLLEFTLKTGRMHQIRVQSASRNYPLVGDTFYGNLDLDKKVEPERLFLHSHSLSFNFEGKRVSVNAPLDHYFLDLINKIT